MKRVLILEPDDIELVNGMEMKPKAEVDREEMARYHVIFGIDSDGDVQCLKHKTLPTLKPMSKLWAQYINAMANDAPMVEVNDNRALTDTDPMPFGKHAGKPMGSIPAAYFHWCWTKFAKDKNPGQDKVADYIRNNMAALQKEHPDGIWD